MTETTWTWWPGFATAHTATPGAGPGVWRTGCGRTVLAEPWPVPDNTPRCASCADQAAGSQRNRPIVPRRQQ